MGEKREKLLKKYIEKKKKQAMRDDLLRQISVYSEGQDCSTGVALIKKKIRKAKRMRAKEKQQDNKENGETQPDKSTPVNFTEKEISFMNARINEEEPVSKIGEEELNALSDKPTASGENQMLGDELFIVARSEKRTNEVQEARKKLGIFYEEAEIISRVKKNLITFIQGSTGCGKTTQIPQFLLENGFCKDARICVTQPRRLAAVSIASRINTELNENLCGYKIKYENSVTTSTKIKVVTEGVLFREMQTNFLLEEYSVIVLDEVHERTTNLDLLIGFLSKIVKIRNNNGKPLRLVLMSATADVDEFKKVLWDFETIYLPSHSHKVSVFYEEKTEQDYLSAIHRKVLAICQASKKKKDTTVPTGIQNDESAGILVFLPTKKDIYMLKSRLEMFLSDAVILPLHSTLSRAEQNRVYEHYDTRKIVLATNIAETSITVEDMVFVIDSGRAKFRVRDESCVKYQIGFISKSSATQRMGRVGRVGPGVCFRIYSGSTFESFREKSVPQIYMEPLDGLMLQLKATGIENVLLFPFPSQPSGEAIKNANETLISLGALDKEGRLTVLGCNMAKFFLAPRVAKLLCLKNENRIYNFLAVIAAIMTVNFEIKNSEANRPYFRDEKSDLIVYLQIFIAYEKSRNKAQFIKTHELNAQALLEIPKLSEYLLKIAGKTREEISNEPNEKEKKEIRRSIYYAFSDQIALNSGGSYVYKNGEIFISKDSIIPEDASIVFDHIVCGFNKSYAKNITVIDSSIFLKNKTD